MVLKAMKSGTYQTRIHHRTSLRFATDLIITPEYTRNTASPNRTIDQTLQEV